jgi:hypothetical protein
VQIDKLAVVMRLREGWEAVDLGIALLRAHLWSFYKVFGVALLVLTLLTMALETWASTGLTWSIAFMWLLKPLLDRIALAHLSRVLFGQTLSLGAAFAELPQLFTRTGLVAGLLWRRLSFKRSMLLPVWQLERASALPQSARSARLKLIGQRHGETGRNVTIIALHMEAFMLFGWIAMMFMLMPPLMSAFDFESFDAEKMPLTLRLGYIAAYALAIALVEPMYVAAGFMLYLHRRIELEGWDIEIAFRRMAQRLEPLAREADRATRAEDELGPAPPERGRA